MKRTNIEFMIGWLDVLRRDDLDSVGAALDPDIVWQGLRDDLVCHGSWRSRRGLRAAARRLPRDPSPRADRRRAAPILHAHGGDLRELEGIPLPDGIYNVFAIEAGRVLRIDDFAKRDEALAVAGLNGSWRNRETGRLGWWMCG